MDLGVELVDRHPVAEVAVQAIGLLDQDDEATLVLAGEGDHAAKGGTTGLFGGFDINELFGDLELAAGGVRSQQIELGRDRETAGKRLRLAQPPEFGGGRS
jgi:hypothetical protein